MDHEIRLEMPMTKAEIGNLVSNVNRVRSVINKIADEPRVPADMARKIDLYIDLQYYVGELYANAVYENNVAYQIRKEKFFIERDLYHGSEAFKDAMAEKAISEERREEAKTKSQVKRWELLYNNCEQKANSLKKRLEILNQNLTTGNGRMGG